MKKAATCLLFLLYVAILSVRGQEKGRRVFVERTADSLYTFYFDSQYYLTDKDCEFFAIKRTGSYAKSIKAFEGKFIDTDTAGTTVLTGNYKGGKMDGTFKAFYPGGYLRWQADFDNGTPRGMLYYYYPDGRPMSILQAKGADIRILNSWNEKGKPVVQNGDGRFELTDPQFGYNVKGYEAIIYKGKVKNGKPDGTWTISYRYAKGENEIAAIEKFDDGAFLSGVAYDNYSSYKTSQLRFTPSEPFKNAELFVAKNCTVDEHYNFTLFLSDYLSKNFDPSWVSLPLDEEIELELNVDVSGRASRITLVKGPGDTIASRALLQILYSIPYWIPSQKEGQLINDTLRVKLNMSSDERKKMTFSDIIISRTKGS